MSDLSNMVQTFGLAVTGLIALSWFIWQCVRWLKPWAEKVLQAHLDFIRRTEEAIATLIQSQQKQEGTLEKIVDTQVKQTDNIVKQTGLMTEWKEASVTQTQLLATFQCKAKG
jgi:small-conductance mechanosensitive channel